MTAAPPLTTLPTTGRFIVETEHSDYIIDMAARTFERWPAAANANILHGDGTALSVVGLSCIVGEPMRIDWRDGSRFDHRVTTPVVSIVPTP
jgi:hypothetical protein